MSEYLKEMSRSGQKINFRDLKYNSNMRYTDWGNCDKQRLFEFVNGFTRDKL